LFSIGIHGFQSRWLVPALAFSAQLALLSEFMPSRTPGLSRYVEYDADTLDAADAYLAYLLPRAAQREPKIVGSGPAKGRSMRRKLHGNAVHRAIQLLNIQRYHEYIWLRETWPERLELAGIDPDTMQVVDSRRWARAWQLLVDTWRFRKADAIYGNTLDLDAPWPCEPVIRGPRKTPRRPKKELSTIPFGNGSLAREGKFDPTRPFRKKIWSPDEESQPTAGDWGDGLQEHCGMPIPDAQEGYGTAISIHNPPSW
jgi:hypothetical protein